MNKKDEALKLAIEALKDSLTRQDVAINACKEALEQPNKNIRDSFNEMLEDKVAYYKNKQPAQEPVDVARVQEDGYVEWNPDLPDLPVGTKLYTHPAPSWQGLSDDEISEFIINKITDFDFARAIEQSLKEKNCSL